MITGLFLLGLIWFGIGGYLTYKFSYWLEDKYNICGGAIHYISFLAWMFLPFAIIGDLTMMGVLK